MKRLALFLIFTCLASAMNAQIDPELLRLALPDSVRGSMNMDAIYDRPFVNVGKLPVSVGGYLEANWQHHTTDGITDGHQFQFRRMTLFVSSAVSRKIKFLSEIEFEEGGKEIAIEFAAIDVEFHKLINLRAGIIMNPIGAFNQNHDGPKWSFTDRPISATQLLPATWSNTGAGIYGKQYKRKWMIGYEIYFSGNFDDRIIDNEHNKTFLPASKENPERFEEINSGLPLITAKIATRYADRVELGLSYMGGVYNKYQDDGLMLDTKRRVDVVAIDMNARFPHINTQLVGEWAWVFINVPRTYTQQYGSRQQGGFMDIVQPVYSGNVLSWKKAVANLALRLEYVDWNKERFIETNGRVYQDTWSYAVSVSFLPSEQTVFRINYLSRRERDLLGNPAAKTAGFSVGVATYF
ncbi:MAG: hypothetical protein EOO01_02255 [Chitinophagaceae bacterium]|nr:MAG: hypothetical protein EOO01_02255 [Chitinophagaceae bacterium]